MKKKLALLLAITTVISLTSVFGASAAGDVNLAAGKTYKATAAYTDRTYPNPYQQIDGKELTDGVKGTTELGTEWHGFYNLGTYYAKVDLGMEYSGIKKISMQFLDDHGPSIFKPKSVEYFISNDNKNFTSVGVATATQGSTVGGGSLYDYVCVPTATATARFIKAVITRDSGMFIFASEFEVFNSGETGVASEPNEVYPDPEDIVITEPVIDNNKINVKAETGMKIVDNYIYGIPVGTSYDYAISQFLGTTGLSIKDKNGNVKTSGFIATGDTAVKTVNNVVTDTKTIVIDGDTDGDGLITSLDYLLFKKAYLGNYELKDAYLKAAYISGTTSLDVSDLLKIKKQFIGNFSIYMSKYAKAVVEYPMTFLKSSDGLYVMETKYNGKSLKLNFEKKDWGTWNIGTLSYSGANIAGCGTDWEYVYRVGDKDHSIAFCGGNHGNEALKDLKFYDGTNDTELTLDTGTPVVVSNIKIVEKTQILFNATTTPWCDVTRTYYIAGNKIELLVDYKFITDCNFDLSYSCMFPVPRDYGIHSKFYNNDGTVSSIEALPKDQYKAKYPTEFTGPYLGQSAATKVKIWGDTKPEYTFDIQVYDQKTSCDDFSNTEKTFLWDMSSSATKLYFSKYGAGSTVKSGTTMQTKSTWSFYIEPTQAS